MAENPQPLKVSVCMISKNEENMIEDCLRSVGSIAHEIILVDTGSNDKTKEIAKKFNCRIFDFKWIDDFSAARNESIKYATGDFILIIDADERLTNPDALLKELNNSQNDFGAWLVDLVSESDRKDGNKDKFKNKLLRLFKNDPDIKFKGSIHEQVLDSIKAKGYKVKESGIQLLHLGYNLSPDEMVKKQKRNLSILEKSIESDPENAYNLYQLAKTYLALQRNNDAEECFKKAIEKAPENGAVLPQALNFGAVNAFRMGNINDSIDRAKRSLEKVPGQSFAHYILGDSYFALHDHKNAIEHFQAMLANPAGKDLYAGIIGDYQLPIEQIYYRLGRSFLALSDLKDAEDNFSKALSINPKEINSLIGLANVLFKREGYKECKDLLKQAKSIDPTRNDIDKFIEQVNSKTKTSAPNSVKDLLNMIGSKVPVESNNELLLSLCMIVKNEEKMLPDCLKSVKDLVDQIVIVDTGSEDRTIDIAKEFGADIFHFDWINDFAAARNESLKHAKGKWILYLDADERIKNTDHNALREVLKNATNDLGGLICTIESVHTQVDEGSSVHRGAYPRLFKNLGYPKVKFTGRVHEQISPAIRDAGLGFVESDIIITHEGYNIDREELEKKLQRNYKLLLDHVNEEPTNGYAWYQLGQTLGQMKLYKESEEAVNFSIKCGNLSDSIYASAANTLAHYAGRKRDFQTALEWSVRSLEKAPEQIYGLNLKAFALLNLGRKDEAAIEFEKALKLLKGRKGIPKSGFDILISEDVIKKGLEQARS